MNKPSVLVTGGAGYIGSHAVLALLDSGWKVVVIDNLSTGFRWAVPDNVAFAEGDIADQALVARLIEAHGIGAIIHFAGSVVVPESVENPLKYYDNNTAKSRSLIESAVKGGVTHFIFSSTAATYGIPQRVPVVETSRTEPINPYGWSPTPPPPIRSTSAPFAISPSRAPIRPAARASRRPAPPT